MVIAFCWAIFSNFFFLLPIKTNSTHALRMNKEKTSLYTKYESECNEITQAYLLSISWHCWHFHNTARRNQVVGGRNICPSQSFVKLEAKPWKDLVLPIRFSAFPPALHNVIDLHASLDRNKIQVCSYV